MYLPDVNFGLYYKFDNESKMFAPYISVAGYHLTAPKASFLGQDYRMPRKIIGYAGSTIRATDDLTFDVNMLFMRKLNNNTYNMGFLCYYHFEGTDYTVFGGPYYRNKDAAIVHFGLQWSEYIFRMSYDVNTSKLNSFSRYRGGFEISVTWQREKQRRPPSLSRRIVPQF